MVHCDDDDDALWQWWWCTVTMIMMHCDDYDDALWQWIWCTVMLMMMHCDDDTIWDTLCLNQPVIYSINWCTSPSIPGIAHHWVSHNCTRSSYSKWSANVCPLFFLDLPQTPILKCGAPLKDVYLSEAFDRAQHIQKYAQHIQKSFSASAAIFFVTNLNELLLFGFFDTFVDSISRSF
jgi:hypothetical protein